MDIRLQGYFLFWKAGMPHMMHQKWGKIINVTSGLGLMAMPLITAYPIAKARFIHLTRILAEETQDP